VHSQLLCFVRPSRTRAMPQGRTCDHPSRFNRLGIIVLGGIHCYEHVFNRMSRSRGEHSCFVSRSSQVRFSPKRSANQTSISINPSAGMPGRYWKQATTTSFHILHNSLLYIRHSSVNKSRNK
jgi:hypothetical protein